MLNSTIVRSLVGVQMAGIMIVSMVLSLNKSDKTENGEKTSET